MRAKREEYAKKRKWVHMACKKKDAGYQPTINCNRSGIYGEKPKTSIQDGRKDKRRIKPHTNLCKDK